MSKPSKGGAITVVRKGNRTFTLSWGAISGASKFVLQYSRNGGKWTTAAVLSKRSTTRKLKKDGRYRYRVAGRSVANGTGSPGPATAYLYTTPKAPSAIKIKPTSSGVSVSWTGNARYKYGLQIEMRGGAGPTSVSLGTGTAKYTVHPYPWAIGYGVGMRFRMRAFAGVSSNRSYSEWSAWSKKTDKLAPPKAPSALSPNGIYIDDVERPTFKWKHNPVDGTDQQAAHVRLRPAGTTEWSVNINVGEDGLIGSAQSYQPTAWRWGTIVAVPGEWEWQVATQGLSGAYGKWSPVATFILAEKPTVDIISPPMVEDGAYTSNLPNVLWDYGQAVGLPQSGWHVQVTEDDGTLLGDKSGSGGRSTYLFNNVFLKDRSYYKVRVRAQTGGLWSEWDEQRFRTEFLLPAEPIISGEWDDGQGGAALTLDKGSGSGVETTESLQLFRSVDNGETWVAVTDLLDPTGQEYIDFQARSSGRTLYRLLAYSLIGAAAVRSYTVESDSTSAWVAAGDTFDTPIRLDYDPEYSWTGGRDRTTVQYRGSERPTAYSGESLEEVHTVGGRLLIGDDPSPRELGDVFRSASPIVLWRDPEDRHFYASPEKATISRENHALYKWSVALEEVEAPLAVTETPEIVEEEWWDDPDEGEPEG